jgi:hypothetical protein
MTNQEVGPDVVDDCGNTHHFMGAGFGVRLYDGLFYSHSAGHCHRRRADPGYSGTKNIVVIRILAGEAEVLTKKGGRRWGKIMQKLCILSGT